MNILSPYDAQPSSASYWCGKQNRDRDEPSYDEEDDVDPEGQPCDPDPEAEGSTGGGRAHGRGWEHVREKIDPPDIAELGGDEDTPQW